MVGQIAAFYAYRVDFLHVFSYRHKLGDGPEWHAFEIRIQTSRNDSHAPVGKGLAHINELLSEELGLIYAHHLHLRIDVEHLGGFLYRFGSDFVEIVGNHLHI